MALVATTAVIAQESNEKSDRRGDKGEKHIERQMKRMDKKLNLSEDQKKQIKDFFTEFDQQKKARMEQMRQQEKRDRDALDSKIGSILTEEQRAKWAEMKAEREKMMKKGKDGMRDKKGRGHGPRGDHKGHGRFGGHGDYRGFEGGMDAPTE